MSAAPTKSELLIQIECQKETIAQQAKTIENQSAEITNAAEQITAICDGMKTIAESNAQTRTMVEEVTEKVSNAIPEPAWWD